MEFHRKRIPFIVKPNNIVLCRHDKTPLSHAEWAEEIRLPSHWITWLRGFYWPETNAIFFYTSANQRNYVGVALQFYTNINRIFNFVGADNETLIHGGMMPDEPGKLWKPIKTFGTKKHFTLGESLDFSCTAERSPGSDQLLRVT